MFKEIKSKSFSNGIVYGMKTHDDYPIEITDTFLPYYTKNATGRKQNHLDNYKLGSRFDRWMIGISCMSGCNIGCKFCATGNLHRWRNLSFREIIQQVDFILDTHEDAWNIMEKTKEFKINYTRMGEPFLNIKNIKKCISYLDYYYKDVCEIHHYVSTIGIKDSDFSWIRDNITLQISVHSLDEKKRDWLIPYKNKMSLKELGQIRTASNLKTTVNLTLIDADDFDIDKLKDYFDPKYFFIKLSPINTNVVSNANSLGDGYIKGMNLI